MTERTDDTAQGDPGRPTVIACDESGSEGDRVFDSANRVFTHAGVHLSTEQARVILSELRGRLRAQSGELKARHLLRGLYARDARHWLFGESGPLAGNTTVWVLDKEFFLTSKIIDLLVEPIAHESGVDLYENRGARQIAYDFHSLGPRSFSSADWDRLKEAFNSLARINQRAGGKVTVDEFMNLLGDLRFKCRRRRMQEIIELLLRSRQHAASIAQQIPSMDPLFAGIPATAYEWFHRLRVPLQIVHDEQNALTSERISQMVSTLTGKHELSKYAPPIKIASFELADSKTDVRLQLADIAAGVVRVYAEHIIQPVGQPEVSLPVQSIQRLILNDSVTSSQEDYTQLTGQPGG